MRTGHLNVCSLRHKVSDISVLMNRTYPETFHIFGISETRLDACISDTAINLPNYLVFRRDPVLPGETGVAVYIHSSIQHLVCRRDDLEIPEVECLWLEFKPAKSRPIFIGNLYIEILLLPQNGMNILQII